MYVHVCTMYNNGKSLAISAVYNSLIQTSLIYVGGYCVAGKFGRFPLFEHLTKRFSKLMDQPKVINCKH